MCEEMLEEVEDSEIDSALVFEGLKRYADYEPRERFAEGSHKRGNRRVEYLYDIDYEGDEPMLLVEHRYYLDDEEKNRIPRCQTYKIEEKDGEYIVEYNGQELKEFIKANFYADLEIELSVEFEDMVEEAA